MDAMSLVHGERYWIFVVFFRPLIFPRREAYRLRKHLLLPVLPADCALHVAFVWLHHRTVPQAQVSGRMHTLLQHIAERGNGLLGYLVIGLMGNGVLGYLVICLLGYGLNVLVVTL